MWTSKLATRSAIAIVSVACAATCLAQQPSQQANGINVIKGHVIDADGKPVAGAQVAVANQTRGHLYYWGGNQGVAAFGQDERFLLFFPKQNGKATDSATTDSEGCFRITGIMDGPFSLAAFHKRLGITLVEDAGTSEAAPDLTVRLDPPTFLNVTIDGLSMIGAATKADGKLVFDASSLRMIQLTADSPFKNVHLSLVGGIQPDGSSRFGPLPTLAGVWNVAMTDFVVSRGFSATLLSVPVSVRPGQTNSATIDLTAGQTVLGHVHGPKDQPLDDVWVSLADTGEAGGLYGTVSDASGNYMIRGVPPGSYKLGAKRWTKRTGFG